MGTSVLQNMIPISVCRHHIFCVSASTGSYSRFLQLLGYVVPSVTKTRFVCTLFPTQVWSQNCPTARSLCSYHRAILWPDAARVCAGEEELLPLHLPFLASPLTLSWSSDAARVCAGEEELLPLHLPLLPDHVHGSRDGYPLPAHPAAPQLPLTGPALLRRGLLLPHHAHVRRLCGDDLHHLAPAGILQAARWASSSLPLLCTVQICLSLADLLCQVCILTGGEIVLYLEKFVLFSDS